MIEAKGADGAKRFALYSFLSTVDFDGTGELVFHYTFGSITVKGKALQPLWEHLLGGTLTGVCEVESHLSEAPSISEITFAGWRLFRLVNRPFQIAKRKSRQCCGTIPLSHLVAKQLVEQIFGTPPPFLGEYDGFILFLRI